MLPAATPGRSAQRSVIPALAMARLDDLRSVAAATYAAMAAPIMPAPMPPAPSTAPSAIAPAEAAATISFMRKPRRRQQRAA